MKTDLATYPTIPFMILCATPNEKVTCADNSLSLEIRLRKD